MLPLITLYFYTAFRALTFDWRKSNFLTLKTKTSVSVFVMTNCFFCVKSSKSQKRLSRTRGNIFSKCFLCYINRLEQSLKFFKKKLQTDEGSGSKILVHVNVETPSLFCCVSLFEKKTTALDSPNFCGHCLYIFNKEFFEDLKLNYQPYEQLLCLVSVKNKTVANV